MSWFTDSKFAFCRGVANHAWQYPPRIDPDGRQFVVTLTCHNCGSERKDRVSAFNGEIATRHYNYADGYRLDFGGKHGPAKHVLRRDGLQLLLDTVKPALTVKNGRRHARRRSAA